MELNWIDTGDGVSYAIEDGVLYTKTAVDDSAIASATDSKSGKTKTIGTTRGFIGVGKGLKLSVNISYKE